MPTRRQNNLIFEVSGSIKKYKFLKKNDSVVAGVSGGPDSVTLLYILNSLKKKLGLKLCVAHLDHGLRGSSAEDLLFVKKLSAKLGLKFISKTIDLKRISQKGSLEEIARQARFDFLFCAAKEFKAKKIALGHNLDDQAETVLMHILRGTGLYGLAGISPRREISGHEIIRPLIGVKRSRIEDFLSKRKISFRFDNTNLDTKFFRNKIRHKLMPALEKEYNPNIKQILANMAENVSGDYEFLKNLSQKALKKITKKSSQKRLALDFNKLKRLDIAIQRILIRLAIELLKGDTRRLTFQHLSEIDELIQNRPIGSIVDLPNNLAIRKDKKYLSLYTKYGKKST